MRLFALLASFAAITLLPFASQENPYAGSDSCASCHAGIAKSYEGVAMSRTFGTIQQAEPIEDWTRNNRLHHKPSNQHFEMIRRDGRYFQRRYQLDASGTERNSLEREIHFFMGSGAHERDYLHREPGGELSQFPVAWYAETKSWGIAPGYDRPDHEGFSRRLNYRCVSCHMAYPDVPETRSRYEAQVSLFPPQLPKGIDCERCHGPAASHVQLASSGSDAALVRNAVVNPAKLDRTRQMDVCLQCHLETTSAALPNLVQKIDRGMFSFKPGERLSDYAVYLDYPGGSGREDDFNIVHQGYRLEKSACFRMSEMTCTTCHNPHEAPSEATAFYKGNCATCHTLDACGGPPAARRAAADNCMSCHMPKRRTDDIVHVVMTDHFIQRRPPANPLALKAERSASGYRGSLRFYLPEIDETLYMGLALTGGADVSRGVRLLERVAAQRQARSPVVYFTLAQGYAALGNRGAAIRTYRRVLELDPAYAEAHYNLGHLHLEQKNFAAARDSFAEAARLQPDVANNHVGLAIAQSQLGNIDEAVRLYEHALTLDPLQTVALNNLAFIALERRQNDRARRYFEDVLRINPSDPTARQRLNR